MKKPELTYPETFIAEREVDGKTEYAFAIKKSFLGLFKYISVKPIMVWGDEDKGYRYIPELSDSFGSDSNTLYFDSPKPAQEAIDNLRSVVLANHQIDLRAYKRRLAGEWKYKPYP